MQRSKQKGGTFASDDLCHTVGQRGFDSLGAMSGGNATTPNLLLPDSSTVTHAPAYVNMEPSHIIPQDLTQQAIYPLYYSTNYAPLLQVGAGKQARKKGHWASPKSPRL